MTGQPEDPAFAGLNATSIRYGLPAVGALGAAVALAGRAKGAPRRAAAAMLLLSGLLVLATPPVRLASSTGVAVVLALLALAGAAIAARRPVALAATRSARPAAAGALLLGTLATWAGATAYATSRLSTEPRPNVFAWMHEQPAFRNGSEVVASNWVLHWRLTGPRLSHPIELLPTSASCDVVLDRARRGWFVAVHEELISRPVARAAPGEACFAGRPPAYDDGLRAVYTELPTSNAAIPDTLPR